MTHKEYNGWYNYETWLVNLWLTNDQGIQEWVADMAERAVKSDNFLSSAPAARLADTLEDQIKEDLTEDLEACSLQADLLGAALSEVNWYELAEHYVADYAEGAD
jgi:hypothetical protein